MMMFLFGNHLDKDIYFELELVDEFVNGVKGSLNAYSVILYGEEERMLVMRLNSFLDDGEMRVDLG
jgi:hypothetical protein